MTVKHLFANDNRRERLNHLIGDYLTDDDAQAHTFYFDLKHEIAQWSTYHEESLKKCQELDAILSGVNLLEYEGYDDINDPFGGR